MVSHAAHKAIVHGSIAAAALPAAKTHRLGFILWGSRKSQALGGGALVFSKPSTSGEGPGEVLPIRGEGDSSKFEYRISKLQTKPKSEFSNVRNKKRQDGHHPSPAEAIY
jgi:hypothetical protein